MKQKNIYLSVTNDVVNDQRVIRTAKTLMKSGANIFVIGRYRANTPTITRLPFAVIRFRMLFSSGPLFYASINIRIFFYLLFRKPSVLVANDLDTLLPNYIVSRIKGCNLVYDAHEYFTGIPEIQDRRVVKWIWNRIERSVFPKLKHAYTVSPSIARLYAEKYEVETGVVRNIPLRWDPPDKPPALSFECDPGKKMIVLQGTGINVDRGAEEAVEAMKYVTNAVLFIIGSGDVLPVLKQKTTDLNLEDKIRFVGRMPYHELMWYTAGADLGLSLDKGASLNYRYSLPNKLFDYIQAGIPVLASDLTEVGSIIRTFGIGELIESHDPQHIAERIEFMLNAEERRKEWKENLVRAKEELCWEKEEKKLTEIYKRVGLEF